MIDFGLSSYANKERKKNDFESLGNIVGKYGRNDNSEDDNQINQDRQDSMLSERDGDYGSDVNSSDEIVFDEMSLGTSDTKTTKEDHTSKES